MNNNKPKLILSLYNNNSNHVPVGLVNISRAITFLWPLQFPSSDTKNLHEHGHAYSKIPRWLFTRSPDCTKVVFSYICYLNKSELSKPTHLAKASVSVEHTNHNLKKSTEQTFNPPEH